MYPSIHNFLNYSSLNTLYLKTIRLRGGLHDLIEGKEWFPKLFPGLWNFRRGVILWRATSDVRSPLTTTKHFPLSSLDGNVLDKLIQVHIYEIYRWLDSYKLYNIRYSTQSTKDLKSILLGFCNFLSQRLELIALLQVNVKEESLRIYRLAIYRIFREINKLPLRKLHQSHFRLRAIIQRLESHVLCIDSLYFNIGPQVDTHFVKANVIQNSGYYSTRLRTLELNSVVGPGNPGPGHPKAAGEMSVKFSEVVHQRQQLSLFIIISRCLNRALEFLKCSLPAVEPGKTRIRWTCVGLT